MGGPRPTIDGGRDLLVVPITGFDRPGRGNPDTPAGADRLQNPGRGRGTSRSQAHPDVGLQSVVGHLGQLLEGPIQDLNRHSIRYDHRRDPTDQDHFPWSQALEFGLQRCWDPFPDQEQRTTQSGGQLGAHRDQPEVIPGGYDHLVGAQERRLRDRQRCFPGIE